MAKFLSSADGEDLLLCLIGNLAFEKKPPPFHPRLSSDSPGEEGNWTPIIGRPFPLQLQTLSNSREHLELIFVQRQAAEVELVQLVGERAGGVSRVMTRACNNLYGFTARCCCHSSHSL